ncbi:YceI family protein [Mesonia sp. K7]|uniref:YceI family protein n=1 Tax=Mesonia sp. K7 TaxID=2218606 RepID=UPI000DA9803B|nr:YceI family protein [Mesonia sp. K7]PZD79541.1 YceI family protein [Mesonia sp. K7]
MKKIVLNSAMAAFVAISVIACKKENKTEVETSENTEVTENTTTTSQSAVTYKLDSEASVINWVGSKPVGDNHTGTIKLSDGSFTVESNELEGGWVTIDMNSINVTDLEGDKKASLESHLKGAAEGKEDHFFNVAKYPTGKFEVTNVNTNSISGNLTLKGVTKPVEIPVSYTINDNGTLFINANDFTINRTEWNVNYASKSVFDDLKDNVINDEIKLNFMIKANKA